MDLNMKSLLFLLSLIGCCAGQDLLPEGPVDAVLGKTVTFKTLMDPKQPYIAIVWSFSDGTDLIPIVTVTDVAVTVTDGYKGRVSVNRTNGSLTLGPLEAKDNGDYSISLMTATEGIKTGETKLRVLECYAGQDLLPEGPVDAVLGKIVTFQTQIDLKEPFIAVIWSFNSGTELVNIVTATSAGERVADDYQGRVSVNRITGSLTLGALEEKDSGDYSVSVVTASEGTKTGETKLRVLEYYAGQDLLPEGPVDAVLGKTVTFQTLMDPKEPYIAIIWSFSDGTELTSIVTVTDVGVTVTDDYQGRVSVNRITGSLTLGPLEEKDSGNYSISLVTASGGTKTGETKLRVLEPVSNLVIKSNVTEAIKLNSTVALTCSAKGSFLKFSWTNGTAPIVADGKRLTLSEKATSSTLIITGVLKSDLVSPIYCTAANKLEMEKSAPFNLSVSYGPDWTGITPPPMYVRKGSNLTVLCSAVSVPPATFTWYHDGAMVKSADGALALSDIQAAQSGKYHCIAFNPKTLRYVSSVQVSVTVLEAISGSKITGPAATLIAGNHTANLSCQATAGNLSTRAWMKDDKPLSPSARVVVSEDGSTVMIKTVQKEDNGEYKCELTNKISSDSATYRMVVNFGPEPVMLTGEDEVEVKDPVSIKCSAVSLPPANYTWKFNGTMTAVTTPEYAIPNAVYKNTGTYTCVAHNAVTGLTAMKSHNLAVREEGALDEEGLSDGAIAGIIIGVLIALAAAIGTVMYCRRKQTIESPY
uniref:cell adhesion molecule CEACAM20-like isoform X3 n=1 Tax=Centroberyx gerrardi TaxID=166262 RepID=UPI003AAAD9F5